MTTAEMVALLKQRTKVQDTAKLLPELRAAYRWVVRKVYTSADGPDLLVTIGEELTALAADTREYDLKTNLNDAKLLGVKALWVKFPTDTGFSPMQQADTNDPAFQSGDSTLEAAPLVATAHPVLYDMVNFSFVRFSPALPSGAIIRCDYDRIGSVPDPTTNNTQEDGSDIPDAFHDAIVSKATAHIFNMLDDSREGAWENRAREELRDAIYTTQRRVRTRVQPFRAGRRRAI